MALLVRTGTGRAVGQPSPWGPYLPKWHPTWDMRNSTILYACNYSGMYDVDEALKYGVVAFDWSNGRTVWENNKPMNDEELLTRQAELVLSRDPGMAGGQPRVWVYRETIQALNFFSSVREKLDDEAFAGWFYRFKDYKGATSNNSYHVPACDLDKCSGFCTCCSSILYLRNQTRSLMRGGCCNGHPFAASA